MANPSQNPLLYYRQKLETLFGIDPRALASLRILIALTILYDLIIRFPDIGTFYTHQGLPSESLALSLAEGRLSVNFMSGETYFQVILFALLGIAAFALLLGYRTRTASFISWFLLMSLQNRNRVLLTGGDEVLLLLLFWGFFLPLNQCWSLDHWASKKKKETHPSLIFSVGSAALLLQFFYIYFFTFLYKIPLDGWLSGDAVYYTLSDGLFQKPFGLFLLKFPSFLKFFTYVVLILEGVGPFLLFSPLATRPLRIGALVAFFFFQIGLMLSLEINLFPWSMMLGLVPFLPSDFWQKFSVFLDNFLANFKKKNRRRKTPFLIQKLKDTSTFSPDFYKSKLTQILVTLFALYVFFFNLVPFLPIPQTPSPLQKLGQALNITQSWKMYLFPQKRRYWLSLPVVLKDGTQVDLLKKEGVPPDWKKPEVPVEVHKNARWNQLMSYVTANPEYFPSLTDEVLAYFVNKWNLLHGPEKQIIQVWLYQFSEDPTAQNKEETPQIRLLRHYNFAS